MMPGLRQTGSVAAADAARLARLEQLETVFPTGEKGLGTALNDMLNAWTDLSSAPGNLTARTVVIARADEFASRLRDGAGQLDLMRNTTQQQVKSVTEDINRIAQDLAKVNQRIIETAGTAHTPNDLYDQRDQLLRQPGPVPSGSGTSLVTLPREQRRAG